MQVPGIVQCPGPQGIPCYLRAVIAKPRLVGAETISSYQLIVGADPCIARHINLPIFTSHTSRFRDLTRELGARIHSGVEMSFIGPKPPHPSRLMSLRRKSKGPLRRAPILGQNPELVRRPVRSPCIYFNPRNHPQGGVSSPAVSRSFPRKHVRALKRQESIP